MCRVGGCGVIATVQQQGACSIAFVVQPCSKIGHAYGHTDSAVLGTETLRSPTKPFLCVLAALLLAVTCQVYGVYAIMALQWCIW